MGPGFMGTTVSGDSKAATKRLDSRDHKDRTSSRFGQL